MRGSARLGPGTRPRSQAGPPFRRHPWPQAWRTLQEVGGGGIGGGWDVAREQDESFWSGKNWKKKTLLCFLLLFVFRLVTITARRLDGSDPSSPNLKLHPLLPLTCRTGPARKHHLHPPPPPLGAPLHALFSFATVAYPRTRTIFELLDERDAAGNLIGPDQAE